MNTIHPIYGRTPIEMSNSAPVYGVSYRPDSARALEARVAGAERKIADAEKTNAELLAENIRSTEKIIAGLDREIAYQTALQQAGEKTTLLEAQIADLRARLSRHETV